MKIILLALVVILLAFVTGILSELDTVLPRYGVSCSDPNAHHSTCEPGCIATCIRPNVTRFCMLPCIDACYCNEGFLYDPFKRLCTKPEECTAPYVLTDQ